MSERSLFRQVSKEEKQAILARFDIKNARQVGEKFAIDLPCVFCLKYKYDCSICPFFPCLCWLFALWKDYFRDKLPDESGFLRITFHPDYIIFDAKGREDLEILRQQLDKYLVIQLKERSKKDGCKS